MKNRLIVFFFVLNLLPIIAQVPDEPFNPMTANGAKHIFSNNNENISHKLFWQNPSNVIYNEVYFSPDSALVANLHPSVKILSGFDSLIVYDSLDLKLAGILNIHTKYYWRVVEFNSSGSRIGPLWYFISQGPIYNYWEDYFDNGLSNYTLIQPSGSSWTISNTTNAGINSPELRFYNSAGFNGTSYLILNQFFDLSPSINPFRFNYSADWLSGEFTIGIAYSLDNGETWIPIWQQIINEDIAATQMFEIQIPNENYIKLALFCSSNVPNSAGYWYIDNLLLDTPLTVSLAPSQIKAVADTESRKVFLSWRGGFTVNPSWGYVIQRKSGLPASTSDYSEIAWIGPGILSYEDLSVQLDSTYTYRIQSREGPQGAWRTTWGNEATAYVPEIVPVELVSFNANITETGVNLNWTTATETNNRGFDVERRGVGDRQLAVGNEEWKVIGFVEGNGTTTETQTYSFVDEEVTSGRYQYRLKQIDFDGRYEYSNIVEAEVNLITEFVLEQNYPNPFNPTTKISWQSPVGSHQTIKVYDVLGNEVTTLVDEYREAGRYEMEFDASNLSSGVYYYQVLSGDFLQTKKMLLIK